NSDWSKFYAPGPEIQNYLKRTVAKYGLQKHVQLRSRVMETVWDDNTGRWRIKVNIDGNIQEDMADILVDATGFLNKWRWPNIPGLHDFEGKLVHSANWDESYNLEGKKVAVLGNGSSGIQIVNAIQPKVASLTTYIRNPTWITMNFAGHKAKDGKNFEYSAAEKTLFRDDPTAHFAYRKDLEATMNGGFFMWYTGHPLQQQIEEACLNGMRSSLKDRPDLVHKLIPTFHPGCRRLTPCDGYLESLQQPNTKICFSQIDRITKQGIQTAETEEEFDLIVCATGFDTSYVPSWKLVGLSGATLEERWRVNPDAFFGVQVDTMPNYFMFSGPNSPIAHGSLHAQFAWTCDYILRWVDKIATQDIKSITPKTESVIDYNEYTQEYLKQTVWADNCRSWYKNGKESGVVSGPYAGSVLHFKDSLEAIDAEHFDIVHRSKNRFKWLGNGLSIRDENGSGDFAWYMEM
ncbi:hypothetical protein B0O99DRAFT_528052, partial [Bisporella sp. PMI_857]